MIHDPKLHVVMYHYVRDLPNTPFPRIRGMLAEDFRRQVSELQDRWEIATLEATLAWVAGEYHPRRDLCLLTFDDGLKDHFLEVFPVLASRRLQGIFFPITSCLEGHQVADVHKNQFLLAALDFPTYRRLVLERLRTIRPEADTSVDPQRVRSTYRFDVPEVAALKYLLNFRLAPKIRQQVLAELFEEHLGDEGSFADELYLSWDEAGQMQADGMLMGCHSHQHVPLARLDADHQRADLATSLDLLRRRLRPQPRWPFSYPYGKPDDSFDATTVQIVSELGFCCAFTTMGGANRSGEDRMILRRIDPKDMSAGSESDVLSRPVSTAAVEWLPASP